MSRVKTEEEVMEICTICHETLWNGRRLTEIGHCQHTFHTRCINRWWESGEDRYGFHCPLCRTYTIPTIDFYNPDGALSGEGAIIIEEEESYRPPTIEELITSGYQPYNEESETESEDDLIKMITWNHKLGVWIHHLE